MRNPSDPPATTQRVSHHLLMAMKLTFYVLIFYLLFSIAAGLLIPGDLVGRYTLLIDGAESCSDLDDSLQEFNVNGVDYRVVPADITELADEVGDRTACWLEIRGVAESGVGDAAAPLYEAALRMADGPVSMERAYQPRFGQTETWSIWLLSILLAVVIVVARRPRTDDQA